MSDPELKKQTQNAADSEQQQRTPLTEEQLKRRDLVISMSYAYKPWPQGTSVVMMGISTLTANDLYPLSLTWCHNKMLQEITPTTKSSQELTLYIHTTEQPE